MAQNVNPATIVQEAIATLIGEYDLQRYETDFDEVAQNVLEAGLREHKRNDQIVREAKKALRDEAVAWEKDEIEGGRLGGIQLYQIWDAKCINGNEWLFYPYRDTSNPHVSWVVHAQEVHIKFDDKRQTPVTLYYNGQLAFTRVGRNGQQPTGDQRQEADTILEKWRRSMRSQSNLRRAVNEFLS